MERYDMMTTEDYKNFVNAFDDYKNNNKKYTILCEEIDKLDKVWKRKHMYNDSDLDQNFVDFIDFIIKFLAWTNVKSQLKRLFYYLR